MGPNGLASNSQATHPGSHSAALAQWLGCCACQPWCLLPPCPSCLVAIIAFIWPFTEGGVCITLLLTRLPYSGGWLYAADLLGAAVGCLGVIFLLLVIDPVSATLWIAALSAGVGWIVIRNSDEVRSLRLSGAVALTMAVAATVHTGLDLTGKSHLGVFWAKGHEQAGTLFERWNTYSRVRVREWGGKEPVGWGYARQS